MQTWHLNLITLFPEMFPAMLGQSLAGRALERGSWEYSVINPRDHAEGKHKCVDDTPYGGGAGMVMRVDVLSNALASIEKPGRKIYMSPRGKVLNQAMAQQLIEEPNLTILCGRYEGVDQRFLDAHEFEEVSIGDYVLSGGEPAAMILMDACIRLLPGVMGNDETAGDESHSNGLLEYPHYTRPAIWKDEQGVEYGVPEVLKNGNHKKIDEWKHEQSVEITKRVRPDLYDVFTGKRS